MNEPVAGDPLPRFPFLARNLGHKLPASYAISYLVWMLDDIHTVGITLFKYSGQGAAGASGRTTFKDNDNLVS